MWLILKFLKFLFWFKSSFCLFLVSRSERRERNSLENNKEKKLSDGYIPATKKNDLYVNKFPFSIKVQLRWFLSLNMTRK